MSLKDMKIMCCKSVNAVISNEFTTGRKIHGTLDAADNAITLFQSKISLFYSERYRATAKFVV